MSLTREIEFTDVDAMRAKIAANTKRNTETGCLEWTAWLNNSGYGLTWTKGRNSLVHRIVWTLEVGPVPEGMIMRHSCDNPKCCELSHLKVGTHKDNSADAQSRGRQAVGETHGAAKLNNEMVKYIRTSGKPVKELATELGICSSAIYRAKNGETWKHVA